MQGKWYKFQYGTTHHIWVQINSEGTQLFSMLIYLLFWVFYTKQYWCNTFDKKSAAQNFFTYITRIELALNWLWIGHPSTKLYNQRNSFYLMLKWLDESSFFVIPQDIISQWHLRNFPDISIVVWYV